jgi:Mg-chelatase subunit ChlD
MHRSIRIRALQVLVALAIAFPIAPAVAVAAFACRDVHGVYATGANNVPGGNDFTTFVSNELDGRINDPVTFSGYALGADAGYGGFDYQPADSAALFIEGMAGLGAYPESVRTGVDELKAYLTDRSGQCGNEVYVLGGWSEGAEVVGDALFELPQSIRNRIAFVAFFGDPRLDAGNAASLLDPPIPWACINGQPIWMRGTSGCATAMGIFGARRPYLPSDIEGRVGSWCRKSDAACGGSIVDILPSVMIDPFTHLRYFDPDAEAAEAAQEAATRLQTFVPAHPEAFDISFNQFVDGQTGADLAIVFDTTGSMAGAITDAKAQAAAMAQLWTSLFHNGRVALIEFKDQGDPFVARVDLGLTSDASAFQTAVNGLSASGGGDTPEAQLSGLMTALDGLDWRDGATKGAIVITDATGKDPEPITNFTRDSVIQHSREIDPVAIYGVDITGNQAVRDWIAPMAAATSGEVVTPAPGQSLSDALADLFESAHANPVARIDAPIYGQVGDTITFNAGDSFSASSTIASYRWDFNGDAAIDQTTTTVTTTHTYASTFHGIASVEVVDADGRSALATADVSIDSSGLAPLLPLAPTAVAASATGTSQVTVTWTPAAADRADGYKVFIADGTPVHFTLATDPDSAVIDGVDLSQPHTFYVAASNAVGNSAGTAAPPVGGTTWVPSVRVDTAGSASNPDVEIGPGGAAYSVWFDTKNSTDYDIQFSKWASSGGWSAEQRITSTTTGRQERPTIGVDTTGNAFVVWTDFRAGSTNPDIYYAKRAAGGSTWTTEVKVSSDTGSAAQQDVQIAVLPNGSAITVWSDKRSSQWNIYSARLAAGATTWGTNLRVTSNTSATIEKSRPRVVLKSDGTAIAVWADARNGNLDIYSATLAPLGTAWSTNVKVSDDPGSAVQSTPALGIDSTGNATVAWVDARTTSPQVRVANRPAATGTWSASTAVSNNANSGGSLISPDIAVRGDGRVAVAWSQLLDIWGTERLAGSSTWTTPGQWSDLATNMLDEPPAVALDGSRLFVMWYSHQWRLTGGFPPNVYERHKAI